VFFQGYTGDYFLAGVLWAGIANYDGIAGDTFIFSKWANVDYELGQVYNDLHPIPPPSPPECVPQPGVECPN
jgi:hypothetical protein